MGPPNALIPLLALWAGGIHVGHAQTPTATATRPVNPNTDFGGTMVGRPLLGWVAGTGAIQSITAADQAAGSLGISSHGATAVSPTDDKVVYFCEWLIGVVGGGRRPPRVPRSTITTTSLPTRTRPRHCRGRRRPLSPQVPEHLCRRLRHPARGWYY